MPPTDDKRKTFLGFSSKVRISHGHYPFIRLVQNDCSSDGNSNLVGSEVLEYIINMRNIWFQNLTTIKHWKELR